MVIKGANGESHNVTSQGQGIYNTVGASAGILSLLQNGGLGNLFNGNNCNGGCSENTYVNRYELNLVTALNAKDGEIALLKADKYTDQKIVEATAYLQGEIGKVSDKLEAFKDAQSAINLQQATYNATVTANIGCINTQIAQLQSLSQLVVPQSKVCDTSGCSNNG